MHSLAAPCSCTELGPCPDGHIGAHRSRPGVPDDPGRVGGGLSRPAHLCGSIAWCRQRLLPRHALLTFPPSGPLTHWLTPASLPQLAGGCCQRGVRGGPHEQPAQAAAQYATGRSTAGQVRWVGRHLHHAQGRWFWVACLCMKDGLCEARTRNRLAPKDEQQPTLACRPAARGAHSLCHPLRHR